MQETAKKKKNKKRNIIIIVLVIIAVAILVIPRLMPKKYAGTEVTVERGDISTYYSFSGNVEAKNRKSIYANQIMQIKEFRVEVGELIEEDDDLYKTTYGSIAESPIDGEVLDIYVSENEQIMAGSMIMEIVDYSNLQISIKVDEYDLSAIKEDVEATVTIHALDKDVTGTVVEVSKEGTYVNGVAYFDAVISIPADDDIRVGMSTEATILNQSTSEALILPMTTIQYDNDDAPFVYIKNDSGLDTVYVELGITDGLDVEILSGLNEGDAVFVPTTQTVQTFGPQRR